MVTIDNYLDNHYIHKSNWLRAAVLGANDGILSIASLSVGVVAANTTREALILATLVGVVAGALSMAAGEYVSVSSQTDIERADIEREIIELEQMPEAEQKLLADIYIQRGLKEETALLVAKELSEHDALAAHVRDELGINEMTKANPIQASLASGIAFITGGLLPLIVTLLAKLEWMEYILYISAILSLVILGIFSAKTGGTSIKKAVIRLIVLGTISMGLSGFVGYFIGGTL